MNVESHENGIHHKLSLLGCLRRANMVVDEAGDDATFGTNVHTWLAPYHQRLPLPVLSDEKPPRTCSENQLAERYAKRFTPTGLGTPLLVEQRLHMLSPDGLKLAGTLDMVTSIDAATCEIIEHERRVIIEPGNYLVDHKTKRQHSNLLTQQMLTSPQFPCYHALWNAAHPDVPLNGTLVNIMFRYTNDEDKGFMTLAIDKPDESAYDRLWSILRDAQRNIDTFGMTHCNPSHCFDWNRVCPMFSECDRVNS